MAKFDRQVVPEGCMPVNVSKFGRPYKMFG